MQRRDNKRRPQTPAIRGGTDVIHRGASATVVALLLLAATTQPAVAQSTAESDPEQLVRELQALQDARKQFLKQLEEFDQRINQLESRLNAKVDDEPAPEAVAAKPQAEAPRAPETAETTSQPGTTQLAQMADREPEAEKRTWGAYEPGKGFVLARTPQGELDFSAFTYARYLNQQGLDESYMDSFGREFDIDIRDDVQFQKLTMNFKGWLFDPRFRYLFYTWTSNTSQGDPAQVVVAGNLGFQFSDAFNLYAGIGALPSTRSTNYTFPNWLKNDHRTIADEYFRGSYTSGVWASGSFDNGLNYRAMLGNNLSQLGVNASQLDDGFNTFSGALWWMPTTGEYGPGMGLGDYEDHDEFSTLFGIHYTHSREDAQGQPGTEGFENSQIRLSDGTRIFSPDPFGVGSDVRKATYNMVAVNGGFKYRGWSLEGEAYYRKVDDFRTTGPIPIDEISDYGFQLQGSKVLVPRKLQAYLGYSKIYGDNGEPWDASVGLNWFPFDRKEMRINVQGLYLKDSPVGYSSVPFAVGGNGWAFTTDVIVAF